MAKQRDRQETYELFANAAVQAVRMGAGPERVKKLGLDPDGVVVMGDLLAESDHHGVAGSGYASALTIGIEVGLILAAENVELPEVPNAPE